MYWATEFMFDGFRFDGVTSILYAPARFHYSAMDFDNSVIMRGINDGGAVAPTTSHPTPPTTVTPTTASVTASAVIITSAVTAFTSSRFCCVERQSAALLVGSFTAFV
jgi:hypothetical protein